MTDTQLTAIIEGNKIIAEFMGYVLHTDHPEYGEVFYHKGDKYKIDALPVFQIKYHLSFDWLMDVVQKIESLFHESITFYIKDRRAYIEVDTQSSLAYDDIPDIPECYSGYCESKIQAAWQAVLAFIKWYNLQTREGEVNK